MDTTRTIDRTERTESKPAYYYGTGRRKCAVARVRLYPGNGQVIVNGKSAEEYFGPRTIYQQMLSQPLEVTGNAGKFNITVKVLGGGVTGQAGAVRHGLARALVQADGSFRPALKKAGFLARDPRVKERKKPGLKRARKAPQYTKR
jgi:small subunit ribosomal protein S9